MLLYRIGDGDECLCYTAGACDGTLLLADTPGNPEEVGPQQACLWHRPERSSWEAFHFDGIDDHLGWPLAPKMTIRWNIVRHGIVFPVNSARCRHARLVDIARPQHSQSGFGTRTAEIEEGSFGDLRTRC